MTTHRKTRDRAHVLSALACVVGLGFAANVEAAPTREPLVSSDGGLSARDAPPTRAAGHSCDRVWEELSAASGPWSAEVSLSRSYQLAGVSSLAPVQEDQLGRFAVRASLFETGEPGLVDVRFGRASEGVQYVVWVTTCDADGSCRETAMQSQRLQCATRRDHATLTVRDVGPHQRVVVSFSK